VSLIVGFVTGLVSSLTAIAIGRRFRLLDQPHGIKIHSRPVPFTGGLAYVLALGVWSAVAPLPIPFVLAAIAIWAVGFADDVWKFEARRKLMLQLAALLLAVPALEGELAIKLAAIVIGVVLVNMFNVLDGLDGLAGGVAFFALLPIAVASEGGGQEVAALTAGFTAAFLIVNVSPARLFLGNQGSLVLGYSMWFIAVSSTLRDPGPSAVLAAGLLWAVPAANAAFVVARRIYERRPVLIGDRSHLYDELHHRLGLRTTLVIAWLAAAVTGSLAVPGLL
jgi:UDP-GlcNAc:undecaprenyl-phosphate GlcNAc-1-phosphate transferase